MKNKELRIEVYGRVQGVTFRHYVKSQADKLGLVGDVQNREDGSVLINAQGTKHRLMKLIEIVQKGPMFAKVDGVSYFWKECEGKYNSFNIIKDKGLILDQKSSFWNLGKKIFNLKSKVPKHIAIIPDGNRRWAKNEGLKSTAGHAKSSSFDSMIGLLDEVEKMGVEYITFWGFSTENWKRSNTEIKFIMDLVTGWLKQLHNVSEERRIRFRHLGRKDRLPKKLLNAIESLEEFSKDFDKLNVQLCLDYGGRDEIKRAVNHMLKAGLQEVSEDDIAHYLDSAEIPDPDLIIRTSGERRMSGFMPYQSTYAEFYFCEKHFPDFGPKDLREAVKVFENRRRRFGGG